MNEINILKGYQIKITEYEIGICLVSSTSIYIIFAQHKHNPSNSRAEIRAK